jgi:hypothetical protein
MTDGVLEAALHAVRRSKRGLPAHRGAGLGRQCIANCGALRPGAKREKAVFS